MDTRGIAEGMTVRGGDGQKLGTVIECAADAFMVEKGLFFPKDYSVRYDQIADVRDGEVYLNVADFEAAPQGTRKAERPAAANEPVQGGDPGAAAFRVGTASVPAREEEVELRKRPVVKEEVRVSKTRRQEERRAEAEVRHEEARVEEPGDVERRGDIEGSGEGRDIDEPEP